MEDENLVREMSIENRPRVGASVVRRRTCNAAYSVENGATIILVHRSTVLRFVLLISRENQLADLTDESEGIICGVRSTK